MIMEGVEASNKLKKSKFDENRSIVCQMSREMMSIEATKYLELCS
jgi:hypothetical protein